MIVGIGTDLVEIARIADSYHRFGQRFVSRILTEQELLLAPESEANFVAYLAKRYAAKEAVAKAMGTGIGEALSFQDIDIRRAESGAPELHFIADGIALAQERSITNQHLSLTDEKAYASAFVVLESK